MTVLAFIPDRQFCGVRDYANHLYANERCLGDGILVKIRKLTFWNCLKAPFSGTNIMHLQHEYSILGFAGCWGFLLLLYLLIYRLMGGKLVITLHTVYDWNQTAQLFAHRTRSRLLLKVLSVYGTAYHRLILIAAKLLIFLSETSRLDFLRITPAAGHARLITIPIGVYGVQLSPPQGSTVRGEDDPSPGDPVNGGARHPARSGPELAASETANTGLAVVPDVSSEASSVRGCALERYHISPQDYVVALFGFAYPNKGYHLAIEAVKILRDRESNLRLLIVGGEPAEGGGQYLAELREQVRRYQLDQVVSFTGYIASEDPLFATVLLRANCFLYPYLKESAASGSLSTTLSARKVYITSDLQMFRNFLPGLKFRAGEAQDLAERIQQAMRMDSVQLADYRERLDNYIANNDIQAMRNQHAEAFFGLMKG